ncbi:MipA/OmpV family protein [Sphingobium sp. 10 DY56-G10]|uniref:MipA/OmpV family protein n=1 Tax=Sphingobium sp. 10 DY56-G10 TaxID=2974918 RepID=UPI0005688143
MPSFRSLLATTFVASLSFTMTAQAQEAEDHSNLTIGVGAAAVPSYEGSDDYRVIPIPQLRGKVHDFAFWTRGPALFVDVIPNRSDEGIDIQLGPVVGARFDRTSRKRIKDDSVAALGKLDTAIEVGGFVGIGKTGVITSAYDNISARVTITKDVAGAHDSMIVTPAIEYFTPLSIRSFVGLGVSADYVGKKYGRYYFDVTPEQAVASGLPAYDRAGDGSGFRKVNFNLTGGYSLSGDIRRGWTLFALGSYSRMLGDYADSPVVAIAGSKDQWIGAIGVGYTF